MSLIGIKAPSLQVLSFSISLDEQEHECDLRRAASISGDLDAEFTELPIAIAFYGFLCEEMKARVEEAKARCASLYAEEDGKLREMKANPHTGKAWTEDGIKQAINRNPVYQEAEQMRIRAVREYGWLHAAMVALKCKESMLMQLGANARTSGTVPTRSIDGRESYESFQRQLAQQSE